MAGQNEEVVVVRAPLESLELATAFLRAQRRLDPAPSAQTLTVQLLSEILHELHDQTVAQLAVRDGLDALVQAIESLRSPVVPVADVIAALVAAGGKANG